MPALAAIEIKLPPQHSRRHATPKFLPPMRCRKVSQWPEDDGWSYEARFNGYRCLACKTGRKVSLWSQHGKSLSERFPLVVNALEEMRGDFTVDGEMVALNDHGRSSLQLLQNSRANMLAVRFYLFDLLHKGKQSLINLSIEHRRAMLLEMFREPNEPLIVAPRLRITDERSWEAMRELGFDSVVAKRVGSVYEPGQNSGAWIMMRVVRTQNAQTSLPPEGKQVAVRAAFSL